LPAVVNDVPELGEVDPAQRLNTTAKLMIAMNEKIL
jgi:hypothetical protein